MAHGQITENITIFKTKTSKNCQLYNMNNCAHDDNNKTVMKYEEINENTDKQKWCNTCIE